MTDDVPLATPGFAADCGPIETGPAVATAPAWDECPVREARGTPFWMPCVLPALPAAARAARATLAPREESGPAPEREAPPRTARGWGLDIRCSAEPAKNRRAPSSSRDRRRAARALAAIAAACLALSTAACVRKQDHDAALRDLQKARTESWGRAARIAALEADIAGLRRELAARDARLEAAATAHADLVRKLDEAVVLNTELSSRLRTAGQNVEQLASERGSMAEALAAMRAELDELRLQQAAADARAAQFRDLVERFKQMIDAGKLRIVVRSGRMLLELPTDVLFDSGRTDIKENGRATLFQVASVLRTLHGRKFQVAGHTDDVKIETARFPSNWELSTARAVEVVKLLVGAGMDPKALSAAGYGEFDPVASNADEAGRARNRRIEIALVPNLEEMVKVRDVVDAAPPKPAPKKPAPAAKAASAAAKPAPAQPAPEARDKAAAKP